MKISSGTYRFRVCVGVGLWLLVSAQVASSSDRETVSATAGTSAQTVRTGGPASEVDGLSIGVLRTPGAHFDHSEAGLHDFGLAVRAFGRESGVEPLDSSRPHLRDGRIEYPRGPLLESYSAADAGLLQGFVVSASPAGEGRLVIAAEIRGDFEGRVLPGRRDAEFRHADGRLATYSGLVAWDADGRDLAARLAISGAELRIEIDDEGARYPLIVDPLIVVERQKLTADVPENTARFGFSVAADGDTLVVGESASTEGALVFAGAVYVYVRGGDDYVLQQKIISPLALSGGNFGAAVDVDRNTLVVGEPGALTTGRAFAFVRNGTTWTPQSLLNPPDVAAGDAAGSAVAVCGDTALVGARGHGGVATQGGAVYAFTRTDTSWSLQQKFFPNDLRNGDHFGAAVSLQGDAALVGAPDSNANGNSSGAAYVFRRNAGVWAQEAKLLPADGATGDQFGFSVSLAARAAVGAPGADANTGAAYVFERDGSTWTEEARLAMDAGAPEDRFGSSISILGNRLAVGARGVESNRGAACLFVRKAGVWSLASCFQASDGKAMDFFGQSIAIGGSKIIVGAPDPGTGAGAAYVFGIRTPGARAAGSLLLFPEFDNRHGIATVVTVTNTDHDEEIDVHFNYIARRGAYSQLLDCEDFDRSELLTPNDTLTVLTNDHDPQHEQGYLYVYAREQRPSHPNYYKPIAFDRLIGNLLVVDGLDTFEYSVNAISYRAGVRHRELTDLDEDGIRDLDGKEYESAPDELLIPRFLAQSWRVESKLILIGLSGGSEYTTTVDFLVYNDNEQAFSRQYTFRCWDKVRLKDIGSVFSQDFLSTFSGDDPYEAVGYMEYGWYRMTGAVAEAGLCTILDPAFYAVHIEVLNDTASADLPFEQGSREGHLLPRLLSGDNSENPQGCGS